MSIASRIQYFASLNATGSRPGEVAQPQTAGSFGFGQHVQHGHQAFSAQPAAVPVFNNHFNYAAPAAAAPQHPESSGGDGTYLASAPAPLTFHAQPVPAAEPQPMTEERPMSIRDRIARFTSAAASSNNSTAATSDRRRHGGPAESSWSRKASRPAPYSVATARQHAPAAVATIAEREKNANHNNDNYKPRSFADLRAAFGAPVSFVSPRAELRPPTAAAAPAADAMELDGDCGMDIDEAPSPARPQHQDHHHLHHQQHPAHQPAPALVAPKSAFPTSFAFTAPPSCAVCTRPVYVVEKITLDSRVMHKTCLRCEYCHCQLKPGTVAAMDGKYFCKPHFRQLFKLNGNYAEGFGMARYGMSWGENNLGAADGGR
ncbi:LIM domain and actin-binding protein 1 [Geranomyces variabilis]|uniref:LIM domain and actin-binding protein 1 n=1 Tax=Geranomyces variabilis TaxID=109894 RepID=A0AAD5TCQ7_9FUNG|nr:LIM domain and actin-binding protein 1 [Geranomyces variabilis]